MARQIILTQEAKTDARDAYGWYEEQDRGLGDEFLGCLESAFLQIARHPARYPVRFDNFRRILIRRFPHAVYFDYDDNAVYIYYVFHCSQNPAKLTKRLRGT
ncbi:MAG TPA: type II toxin-antitoxin system RelE/ParE family toxin [Candidatus Methylacidiphilales bacterium]|nr:type II toxin-antitoxin system RelE/ParE family toxin [Candidatus Methylacidiphilales bacterium]